MHTYPRSYAYFCNMVCEVEGERAGWWVDGLVIVVGSGLSYLFRTLERASVESASERDERRGEGGVRGAIRPTKDDEVGGNVETGRGNGGWWQR